MVATFTEKTEENAVQLPYKDEKFFSWRRKAMSYLKYFHTCVSSTGVFYHIKIDKLKNGKEMKLTILAASKNQMGKNLKRM